MEDQKKNYPLWKVIAQIVLWVGLIFVVPPLLILLWLDGSEWLMERKVPEVREKAETYLDAQYPGHDFEITNAYHSWYDSVFYVKVQSRSSADTYFTVTYDNSLEFFADSYERRVVNRGNTAARIVEDYETQAKAVLEAIPGYDWSQISFVTYSENTSNNLHFSPQGLDCTTLELDGEYDAAEMGWDYGWLTVYFLEDAENLTVPRVLERLRQVDEAMTKAGVGYQVVEIRLITDPDLVRAKQFTIYAIRREYLQSDDPLAVLQALWEEQEANRQALKEQWAKAGEG